MHSYTDLYLSPNIFWLNKIIIVYMFIITQTIKCTSNQRPLEKHKFCFKNY